jgi:hypothetical protein
MATRQVTPLLCSLASRPDHARHYGCSPFDNRAFERPGVSDIGTAEFSSAEVPEYRTVEVSSTRNCSHSKVLGAGHAKGLTCGPLGVRPPGHLNTRTTGLLDARPFGTLKCWACGHAKSLTCSVLGMRTSGISDHSTIPPSELWATGTPRHLNGATGCGRGGGGVVRKVASRALPPTSPHRFRPRASRRAIAPARRHAPPSPPDQLRPRRRSQSIRPGIWPRLR